MTATRNPFDLTGRVALVTGAARGLGHAIAAGLANPARKYDTLPADALSWPWK